jgi:two-component system, OmpR family, response regulator
MCEYLTQDGYSVFQSRNGEAGLALLGKTHIDLLITDVMMPEMDGFELSESLRDAGIEIPILMVTAKGAMEDKRTGFGSGADDYMVKPIDMEEMLLRVSALLRRVKTTNDKKLTVGETILDYNDFSVVAGGQRFQLPNKEFQIVFKLLSQPNQIFTRTQLMDEIWGYENESMIRTVDVHIRKLREKFEGNRDFEIVTVKGLGYKAVKLC